MTVLIDPKFLEAQKVAPKNGGAPVAVTLEATGVAEDASEAQKAVAVVQGNLVALEGTGDDLTGTPTGEGGISDIRQTEIETRRGRPMTDKEARDTAVNEDSALLHNSMPGFAELPAVLQAVVLDLSYNVGVHGLLSPTEYPKLRRAISGGHYTDVIVNTLDVILLEGQTVRGLARRRALMFNMAIRNPHLRIVEVEQKADGTILYWNAAGFAAFRVKGPRHPESAIGRIKVSDG